MKRVSIICNDYNFEEKFKFDDNIKFLVMTSMSGDIHIEHYSSFEEFKDTIKSYAASFSIEGTRELSGEEALDYLCEVKKALNKIEKCKKFSSIKKILTNEELILFDSSGQYEYNNLDIIDISKFNNKDHYTIEINDMDSFEREITTSI